MNPYLLKRLQRRPWLSLCSLILTAAMCFLLCFMTGYLQRQEQELEQTKVSFDILCVVTSRDGTRSSGLRMAGMYIGSVGDTSTLNPHIRDLRITKELTYSSTDLHKTDNTEPRSAPMLGVSSEHCADALDPSVGGDVVYLTEGFYESTERICLVSEEHYRSLKKLQPEVEDGIYTISCLIEDPFINRDNSPEWGRGRSELTVVGYYKGKGETIYLPFEGCCDLVGEISGRISCDSISFLAADNLRLEELAQAASEHYGEVVPGMTQNAQPAYALTIHDEQYRATLATLEQNIRRTQILLPLLLVLGFGMGFLISFLATRGEKRSYALMRTVGLTRGKLLLSIMLEQTLLPLLSAAIIGAVMSNMIPCLMYLICHCVGCAAVALRAVRVPPTAILREQE